MHAVYVVASLLLFALVWPLLAAHPKLRQGFRRRLGDYPTDFLAGKAGPRIWLHGASAGDLLALLPIHRELKRLRPDATIIVSTMTNSGATIAEARFTDADAITFVPWDVFFAVNRAVDAIRPDVLVLEYTELWPNLVRAVKRRGGRVVVTNGRLSERNVGNYRLLFGLIGNLLKDVDLLLMRENAERERALSLGAPPGRVHVTGNTKFDALLSTKPGPVDDLSRAFSLRPEDRLLVAGSTHEGEEALLFDVFATLRKTFPELRLVVAPRYLERVTRIVTLAQDRGLEVSLRSAASPRPTAVVVLDTIGELAGAYQLATLVFIGGSFTSRGGQNILEPAACAKPVLFGPHMENFHDSVQVLVGRGAIQVNDARHLETVAAELLARPAKIVELGALAKAVVSSVSGASTRNAKRIVSLLPPRAADVMRARLERLLARVWASRSLALLLLPLSWAWSIGAGLHRSLYSIGLLRRQKLPVPVISVGNLVVGGAGKTPVTLLLARRLLEAGRRVAVLSRGYGRTSREPVIVVSDGSAVRATADEGGDEPVLLAHRVPGLIVVTGTSRAQAGQHAVELGADLVLLDDGFSHHALHRDADVLVVDADLGFGNGRTLPSGPLREPPRAAARADLVWLTRCPDATASAPAAVSSKPTVRSTYATRGLVDLTLRDVEHVKLADLRVLGLCGIARPASFERTLAATGANVRQVLAFADHHAFTRDDVERVMSLARSERAAAVVTTEKDAVRLAAFGATEVPIYALRMDVELLGDESGLDDLVRRFAPAWKSTHAS